MKKILCFILCLLLALFVGCANAESEPEIGIQEGEISESSIQEEPETVEEVIELQEESFSSPAIIMQDISELSIDVGKIIYYYALPENGTDIDTLKELYPDLELVELRGVMEHSRTEVWGSNSAGFTYTFYVFGNEKEGLSAGSGPICGEIGSLIRGLTASDA